MKKLLLLISIGLGVHSLSAQTHYSAQVEQQIKQVEHQLAGFIKIEGIPDYTLAERMVFYKLKGLSIAVVNNYKIVWAKGYGWADEEEKRPVTTETLFEPGSISKSINAMGILKLAQDKKLDLNTDINTYLTSWKFPYDSLAKNKKITLMNLLSHTAGLTVHGFPGYNRKDNIPTVVQVLNGEKPANTPPVRSQFEPGLKFQYSGGGTTITQLILVDYTKMPYDKFMTENVLKPMGMNHSFFTQPPPADKLDLLASGYYEDGSKVDNKFHIYPEMAPAGLWTTPTDLCNYIIETQLAYQGKSAKVLNQEITKLRLTPYLDKSSALGVFIENRGGENYFQHGAANEGFRGIYYGSMEGGNGLAICVNSDNDNILDELINAVANVYNWKGFDKPVVKKEITLPDSIQQKYLGTYLYEGTFGSIIKKENGYYLVSNDANFKMHFSSTADFFNTESSLEKHFTKDASGRVNGFTRTKASGEQLNQAWKIMNVDTLNATEDFFNSVGWCFLENMKYDDAINYLKRGLLLYPKSLFIEGNLAHAYLFNNNYQAAIKIYKQHLDEYFNDGFTWKDMIKQDFAFFRNNKFDTSAIDKVMADLKLSAEQ